MYVSERVRQAEAVTQCNIRGQNLTTNDAPGTLVKVDSQLVQDTLSNFQFVSRTPAWIGAKITSHPWVWDVASGQGGVVPVKTGDTVPDAQRRRRRDTTSDGISCYQSGDDDFEVVDGALPLQTSDDDDDVRRTCAVECSERGWQYAAIIFLPRRATVECRCGDRSDGFSTEASSCDFRCAYQSPPMCFYSFALIDVPAYLDYHGIELGRQSDAQQAPGCYQVEGTSSWTYEERYSLPSQSSPDRDPKRDCAERCESRRYRYGAVQFYRDDDSVECFCGDDTSEFDRSTQSYNCDYECAYTSTIRCESYVDLIDVDEVLRGSSSDRDPRDGGCFTEGTDDFREMGRFDLRNEDNPDRDVKRQCVDECRRDRYNYAAVKFYENAGDIDCYCGSDVSDVSDESSGCDYDCAYYRDDIRCDTEFDIINIDAYLGGQPVDEPDEADINQCYDRYNDRYEYEGDIDLLTRTNDVTDPRERCAELCDDRGRSYAVLEFQASTDYVRCYCGDRTDGFGDVAESNCDFRCALFNADFCRDGFYLYDISEYLSSAPSEPEQARPGCYDEGFGGDFERVDRFLLRNEDGGDDPRRICVESCDDRRKTFAALRFRDGEEDVACECGDDTRDFRGESNECDYDCAYYRDDNRCRTSFDLIDVADYLDSEPSEPEQAPPGCYDEGFGGDFERVDRFLLRNEDGGDDPKRICVESCDDREATFAALRFRDEEEDVTCECGDDTRDFRGVSNECDYDCAYYRDDNRCRTAFDLIDVADYLDTEPPIEPEPVNPGCYAEGFGGDFDRVDRFDLRTEEGGEDPRPACVNECYDRRNAYAALRFREDEDTITCECGDDTRDFSGESDDCDYDCAYYLNDNRCRLAFDLISVDDYRANLPKRPGCYGENNGRFTYVQDIALITRATINDGRDPQGECAQLCRERDNTYALAEFREGNGAIACYCGEDTVGFGGDGVCEYNCALFQPNCGVGFDLFDVDDYLGPEPVLPGCYRDGFGGDFVRYGYVYLATNEEANDPRSECVRGCMDERKDYAAIRFRDGEQRLACECGDVTTDFSDPVNRCDYDCALRHDQGDNRCETAYHLISVADYVFPPPTSGCFEQGSGLVNIRTYDLRDGGDYEIPKKLCAEVCRNRGDEYGSMQFRSGDDAVSCACGSDTSGYTEETDMDECSYRCARYEDDNRCEDVFDLFQANSVDLPPPVNGGCFERGFGGDFDRVDYFDLLTEDDDQDAGIDPKRSCVDECIDREEPYAALRFRENDDRVACECGRDIEDFEIESNHCDYTCAMRRNVCEEAYELVNIELYLAGDTTLPPTPSTPTTPSTTPRPLPVDGGCFSSGGADFMQINTIRLWSREQIDAQLGYPPDEACANSCQDRDYPYAMLIFTQNSRNVQCRCGRGDQIDSFLTRSTQCNLACAAGSRVTCRNARLLIPVGDFLAEVEENNIWDNNEPNNEEDSNPERCGVVDLNRDLKMSSKNCRNTRHGYICQYVNLDRNACVRERHAYMTNSTMCISIEEDNSAQWFQAKEFCRVKNGALATWTPVLRTDVLAYIEEQNSSRRRRRRAISGSEFFVGAHAMSFVWQDGNNVEFNEFGNGEPNLRDGECVTINLEGDDSWESTNCANTAPYVCEVSPIVPLPTTPTTLPPATTPTEDIRTSQPPVVATTQRPKATSTKGPNAVGYLGAEDDETFTTGVIAAIVVAAIAVLIALIRLIVYCCQRNSSKQSGEFYVNKSMHNLNNLHHNDYMEPKDNTHNTNQHPPRNLYEATMIDELPAVEEENSGNIQSEIRRAYEDINLNKDDDHDNIDGDVNYKKDHDDSNEEY